MMMRMEFRDRTALGSPFALVTSERVVVPMMVVSVRRVAAVRHMEVRVSATMHAAKVSVPVRPFIRRLREAVREVPLHPLELKILVELVLPARGRELVELLAHPTLKLTQRLLDVTQIV